MKYYDCISAINVILKIKNIYRNQYEKKLDKVQNVWMILAIDNILRWFEHTFYFDFAE